MLDFIKIRQIFSITILLFCFFQARSQVAQNHISLYICMNDLGEGSQRFIINNHIQQVTLLDQRYIDPNNKMQLDKNILTNAIKEKFPDSTAGGIGILDWEGDMLANLKTSPQSAEFKKAMDAFTQVIQLAKSIRPNVKWGFYYLPFTTYWNRDDKLIMANQQVKPLLEQCDILFPSLYIFYKDGSVSANDNEAYASDNINQILMIAKSLNKPVLPFIWHRYHDSNRNIGLQLIPIGDFKKFIDQIVRANYSGKRISGLVWWGADAYYYRVKSKALVDEMSMSNSQNFSAHDDSVIINYGNMILQRMKKIK